VLHKATYSDANRPAAGIVGIMWDITKRKKAERRLKRNEARYRTLFESANDAILNSLSE
jgi:PAS domain-containing protein